MLTRLRLKNWRSVKEETIDFTTPITVFIGANSSGKSNLIDTFYFLREALNDGVESALYTRGGKEKLRTLGDGRGEAIEIEIFYQLQRQRQLTYNLQVHFDETNFASWTTEKLTDDRDISLLDVSLGSASVLTQKGEHSQIALSDLGLSAFGRTNQYPEIQQTFQFVSQRWQLLTEGFSPVVSNPVESSSDTYLLNKCADNLPAMLEFMQQKYPEIFADFQNDLSWLLEHVSRVKTERIKREVRFYLQEKQLNNQEAPTISAGTGRIAAVIAAHYALDMRLPKLPGLIVVEEPDTALNPGLLHKFVEQLRNYAEDKNERQFILTTHNPAFLDFFNPEEVRVVERDEQGYSHVHRIPEHVKAIWLDKYGLGEVWTTNSFGGLPE